MTDAPPADEERALPALYMLHRAAAHADDGAPVDPHYDVRPVASERLADARPVVELGGALPDAAWEGFAERVLPDGLFVAVARESGARVGTAAAAHNPRGSRFHFPGGGELGYLVVDPSHRGRGLGLALTRAVVARFRAAGYRHVWLGVQGWRLPAVRTYLRAGFVPLLHPPHPEVLERRWRRVHERLGLPADPAAWPRALPAPP